jgi:hypothetical protein
MGSAQGPEKKSVGTAVTTSSQENCQGQTVQVRADKAFGGR